MSPVTTWRDFARSTFRSVKLLIELPACSKNAQKSIEKKVRISTTNMRSRRILSSRKLSTVTHR